MKPSKNELGSRIKHVRSKILKATQKTIAQKLDKSRSFISSVENGKSYPSWDFILSLINDIHFNPKFLQTGEGDPILSHKNGTSSDEEMNLLIKKLTFIRQHQPRLFDFIKVLFKYEIIQDYTLAKYGLIQYDDEFLKAMKNKDDNNGEKEECM